jgi:hypothetical protein
MKLFMMNNILFLTTKNNKILVFIVHESSNKRKTIKIDSFKTR